MSLVAAADYTMWFKDGYEPEDEDGFWTGLSHFLEKPSISIVKKTKKGVKEIDLKPYLYEIVIESPFKGSTWKEDSPTALSVREQAESL